MANPSLKVVGGTATGFGSVRRATDALTTTSTTYSVEDLIPAYSTPRPGPSVNELWREIAVYQQHVKAISRTSATFVECLQKWKEDTQYLSSLSEIIMHPSYQRIIGLGPDVVPFILRELAENGGHWFWALQSLTGEDPVSASDRGRGRAMREAWVEWGKSTNLL